MRKQGIAERDLRTTSTQVTQSFVYKESGVRGEPDGFVATTTVSAKLRNLAKSSSLLDDVASQGATTIMGPTYELSNDVPLRRQARDMAIREAQKNAEEVASTLNKKVLRLVSLRLSALTPPSPERARVADTSVGSVQVRGSTAQILPGELQVSSTINAVFELTD